jgi:hypothetical protein
MRQHDAATDVHAGKIEPVTGQLSQIASFFQALLYH